MQPLHLKRPVLHLFAAAAALLVVGCGEKRPDSAWWQDEEQRIGLEHELQLKTFRFDQVYSDDFNQLQSLRKSNTDAAIALVKLRSQKEELSTAVVSLERQLGDFRRMAILEQRQRAKGQVFEQLTLSSGRTFRAVSISSIDDGGVTIRHEDGSAKLRFADLSADQRLLFGLEGDLALVAEDREREDAVAYERWIDNQLVAMKGEERKESAEEERRELAAERKRTLAAMAAARNLLATNPSPLAQPARSVGSSDRYYSYHYSTYRRYTPVYRSYCAPSSSLPSSQMHYLRTGRMPQMTPTPTY